jgi:hypothetical protein
MTNGRVGESGGVARERSSADTCIVLAVGVVKECLNPNGCV